MAGQSPVMSGDPRVLENKSHCSYQLRNRSGKKDAIMKITQQFDLSIVIPTYKRLDCLNRLLDSLYYQTARKDIFEVIVVDNAPAENPNKVQEMCENSTYCEMNLRYIHMSVAGVSAARNRGVEAANAEMIGFLDDDCLPKPDWVEKVIELFGKTKADILGGPFEPYTYEDKPVWFHDEYVSVKQSEEAGVLTTRSVTGGNMAWRKKVFLNLGGFSTTFGHAGRKRVFGEEAELHRRARLAGYTTWYDPWLIVQHYIHLQRMQLVPLFFSGFFHGQARARLKYNNWRALDSRPVYRQFLSHCKILFINIFKIASAMFFIPFRSRDRYPYWQNYMIEFVMPFMDSLGFTINIIFLLCKGKAL
jgi:glucosyl-dolichyl phosphate glucuronosyltransferase